MSSQVERVSLPDPTESGVKKLQLSFSINKPTDGGTCFKQRDIPPHFEPGFKGFDPEKVKAQIKSIRRYLDFVEERFGSHTIGRELDKVDRANRHAPQYPWAAPTAVGRSGFLTAEFRGSEVGIKEAKTKALKPSCFYTLIDTKRVQRDNMGTVFSIKGTGRVQIRKVLTSEKGEGIRVGLVVQAEQTYPTIVLPSDKMCRCINLDSPKVILPLQYPNDNFRFSGIGTGMRIKTRLYRKGGESLHMNTFMVLPLYRPNGGIFFVPVLVEASARYHAYKGGDIGDPWQDILRWMDTKNDRDSMTIEKAIIQLEESIG